MFVPLRYFNDSVDNKQHTQSHGQEINRRSTKPAGERERLGFTVSVSSLWELEQVRQMSVCECVWLAKALGADFPWFVSLIVHICLRLIGGTYIFIPTRTGASFSLVSPSVPPFTFSHSVELLLLSLFNEETKPLPFICTHFQENALWVGCRNVDVFSKHLINLNIGETSQLLEAETGLKP